MRLRICILMVAILALAACAGPRSGRQVVYTPAPLKTLRPTFTATPATTRRPATPAPVAAATAVPTSAAPTAPAPAPTPVPPSPTAVPPSPTPEKASFTVSSPGTTNVRSGPGLNYPVIGEVQQGQKFEITGKNQTGTWWQFDYNGRAGWISGERVSPNAAAANVPVAAIPAAPTQPPPPPATPRPPTQPPPPPAIFAQAGAEIRDAEPNFNLVTFWGRLGQTGGNAIGGGYRLRVNAPSGNAEAPFGDVWQNAYPGMGGEFRYNAKIELPRTAGSFRAVVIDGSGKEVGDVIAGVITERSHDVILTWWPR